MVNTFLVTSDFRTSASLLDMKRLGKQRVEAMQILHMLQDLDYLTWYLEIAAPPRGGKKEEIYTWIDRVIEGYAELPYRLLWDANTPNEPISAPKGFKYQRAKDNEIFKIEGDMVHLTTKTGKNPRFAPLRQFLFPGQRLLGEIRKHSILVLWYTYTDALAEYINLHIEEWITRGYKNTMVTYLLPERIDYPPWVENPEFYRTMCARLREKELRGIQDYKDGKRKTKVVPWYTTMEMFNLAGEDTGYVW